MDTTDQPRKLLVDLARTPTRPANLKQSRSMTLTLTLTLRQAHPRTLRLTQLQMVGLSNFQAVISSVVTTRPFKT